MILETSRADLKRWQVLTDAGRAVDVSLLTVGTAAREAALCVGTTANARVAVRHCALVDVDTRDLTSQQRNTT